MIPAVPPAPRRRLDRRAPEAPPKPGDTSRPAGADEPRTLRENVLATPLYVWLFLAGIASAMLSGYSGQLGLPISLDRVLLPAAIVLLALDGRRPRMRVTAAHWLFVVLVLWTVVDMILHGTISQSSTLFALLDRTIMPFLVFLVAPLVFDTPFRRELLLVAFTAIGAYLGVTALLETFAPNLVLPSYITNEDLGTNFGRARGPMMGSDALGVSAVVTGACALQLTTVSRGWLRVAGYVTVALSACAVLLCQTRAVWVGLVVAVAVVAVLAPSLRRRIALATIGGAGLLAVLLLAVPQILEQTTERTGSLRPIYDRLGSNDAALSLLSDLPLTGIGWRRFYPDGAEWFRQSDAYPTNAVVIEIHNVVLSRAAELGLIFAALFVALLAIGPGRNLWSAPRAELHPWRLIAAASFSAWFGAAMR